MEEIFLIEKIWIDPMENESSAAVGYKPFCWARTKEEAEALTENCRIYTRADCWAIMDSMPEYTCRKLKKCSNEQIQDR